MRITNVLARQNSQVSVTARGFMWNVLASLSNAAATVLLLMAVNRLLGQVSGGIFSFGLSVAQVLMTVGGFEVRPFQVTDTMNRFDFSTYHAFRILTCGMMIILAIVYGLYLGITQVATILMILLVVYKLLEVYSEVFQGHFQKNGDLVHAGKSMFYKISLSVIGMVLVMAVTRDLMLSLVVAILVSAATTVFYDFRIYRRKSAIRVDWNRKQLKQLMFSSLALFGMSFLSLFTINMPKLVIERSLSMEFQNIYNILFLPASVVNLMMIFILRPLLTPIAVRYNSDNRTSFFRSIRIMSLLCVACTVASGFFFYFFGVPILTLMYGVPLAGYQKIMALMIAGGGANAMAIVYGNALTIMRRQNRAIFAYIAAVLIALATLPYLVVTYQINGAAVGYTVSMVALAIGMLIIFAIQSKAVTRQMAVTE